MSDVKVYKNMSYEDYDKLPGLRQSWLNYLNDCPASLRWHLDHMSDEEEDTDATILGNAVDCLVTTPEQFDIKYCAGPDVKKNTKAGKEQWESFLFANPGKIVLKGKDFQAVNMMASNVMGMKTAKTLLDGAEKQLVIQWTEKLSGVLCKARLDGWNEKLKTGIDLKTTRSVRMFRKSLEDYGYHRQAAWYMRALSYAGLNPEHFCFIVVDKNPPYGVMVFRLVDKDIQLAWINCHTLLTTYQECKSSNTWAGYADEVQDIELMPWARERLLGGNTNG
jgi:hypothetical protein